MRRIFLTMRTIDSQLLDRVTNAAALQVENKDGRACIVTAAPTFARHPLANDLPY